MLTSLVLGPYFMRKISFTSWFLHGRTWRPFMPDSSFLTPCWPLRMASTDRGVPKQFSSRECAWSWPKLLANIFWAIYCCSEVFQVSMCFRCNYWYILGTLLQGTGNDGLYPSDHRVLGVEGMQAQMAPQRCQRHTGNYLPKHNTKYLCSL